MEKSLKLIIQAHIKDISFINNNLNDLKTNINNSYKKISEDLTLIDKKIDKAKKSKNGIFSNLFKK